MSKKWKKDQEVIVTSSLKGGWFSLCVLGVGPKFVRIGRKGSDTELYRFNITFDIPRCMEYPGMNHLYTVEEHDRKVRFEAEYRALKKLVDHLQLDDQELWTPTNISRLETARQMLQLFVALPEET